MDDLRRGRWSTLTNRQRQVLLLVIAGCSNREIGSRLGVSLSTAKWHVSRLMVAFGVSSRVDLVREAETDRRPGRDQRNSP